MVHVEFLDARVERAVKLGPVKLSCHDRFSPNLAPSWGGSGTHACSLRAVRTGCRLLIVCASTDIGEVQKVSTERV